MEIHISIFNIVTPYRHGKTMITHSRWKILKYSGIDNIELTSVH
jgi:hypothetical protein